MFLNQFWMWVDALLVNLLKAFITHRCCLYSFFCFVLFIIVGFFSLVFWEKLLICSPKWTWNNYAPKFNHITDLSLSAFTSLDLQTHVIKTCSIVNFRSLFLISSFLIGQIYIFASVSLMWKAQMSFLYWLDKKPFHFFWNFLLLKIILSYNIFWIQEDQCTYKLTETVAAQTGPAWVWGRWNSMTDREIGTNLHRGEVFGTSIKTIPKMRPLEVPDDNEKKKGPEQY